MGCATLLLVSCTRGKDLSKVPFSQPLSQASWPAQSLTFRYPTEYSNRVERAGSLALERSHVGQRYRFPIVIEVEAKKQPDEGKQILQNAVLGDVSCKQVSLPDEDFATFDAFIAKRTLPDGRGVTVTLHAAGQHDADALKTLRLVAEIATSIQASKPTQ